MIGIPDETRAELVKAFIVLAEGYTGDNVLKKKFRILLKASTTPYKYPREIEFKMT